MKDKILRLKKICHPPSSTNYPDDIKKEWIALTEILEEAKIITSVFNGNGFYWNTPYGDDVPKSEEYKFHERLRNERGK